MDIIKNVSSIIGLVLSCITLLTLCSKSGKKVLASIFKKYTAEEENDIQELKESIKELSDKFDNHLTDFDKFKNETESANNIALEFTKQQCRNIIKNIFYNYYDIKILPLYEHKTLMAVKDIYIKKLHGNSYASGLIKEMEKWEIDYKSSVEEE